MSGFRVTTLRASAALVSVAVLLCAGYAWNSNAASSRRAVTVKIPAPAPISISASKAVAMKAAAKPAFDPASFTVHRVLPIDGPFRHGDYVWEEAGAPAGPVVVTVDLEAETLSVFRAGYEIGSAVILFGANDKPTPLGTFAVSQKDADHISNLYDAPMPFMLRLTNDGVSIHGSDVVWGKGTHGCIGVPTAFARKLFGVVKLGDPVIVTRGRMMKVA